LIGGRQAQLGLAESVEPRSVGADGVAVMRTRPAPLAIRLTDADRAAHAAFVATLGDGAIWRNYRT
jgi:DNA polymerase-3 subunit epsilon